MQMRDLTGLMVEISYNLLTGIGLGFGYTGKEYFTPPYPPVHATACPLIIRNFCQTQSATGFNPADAYFYQTMIFGCISAISSTATFGGEKTNFRREVGSGINIFSYFLAKNIYDIWNMARNAMFFVMLYELMATPPGNFGVWYFTVLLTYFCGYGLGYLISILHPKLNEAMVLAVIIPVAWSITSGYSPQLNVVEQASMTE